MTSREPSSQQRRNFMKLVGTGMAAGVAGCIGDEGSDENTDTTNNQNNNGTSDADDEFVFVGTQTLATKDPARMDDYVTVMSGVNLYEPLLWIDSDSLRPVENIATGWEVENDGYTWVVELQQGIEFHSGGELTAEDVVYSIDRLLTIGKGYAGLWGGVLSEGQAEVRDDYTVEFNLDIQYGPFLSTLLMLFVVEKAVVRENEADGPFGDNGDYGQGYLDTNSAGCGPYKPGEWDRGSVIRYEKFDNYWKGWDDREDGVNFETARHEIINEESTIKLMMEDSNADMTSTWLSSQAYEDMSGYDNVTVESASQLQSFNYLFNCQKAPTDDLNVRKAIAYAYDYETVVNNILSGSRNAASIPDNMPGNNDDLEPITQDPDQARAALEASEYTAEEINDIGLTCMFFSSLDFEREMAIVLQENLGEVLDIELELEPTQGAQITERLQSVETQPHLSNLANTAKIPTPDQYTYWMFHPDNYPEETGQSYAAARWTTPELQEIIEDARTTADTDERYSKYQEAERIIYENHPAIFIGAQPYEVGRNTSVGNWSFKGILSFDLRFSDMYRKNGQGN